MKNGDQSIVPSIRQIKKPEAINEIATFESWGLTKREYFAAMAMQGLLSNSSETNTDSPIVLDKLCNVAINAADNILKQLDSNK